MENASVFENEGDFCSNCGAILILDHSKLTASCFVCHNKTSIKKLIGMKYEYTIEFTPLNYHQANNKKDKPEESIGQMDNERECRKCRHKGMSYTTMQLRSADEGQTIFYFCPQCRNREVENS